MPITVHHQPLDPTKTYKLHAWNGSSTWDIVGVQAGGVLDFALPDVGDPRALLFKYYVSDPTQGDIWEPDDYIRRVWQLAPTELWSFEYSARVLYTAPSPAGAVFAAGDVLTFNAVSQSQYNGGQIYVWNGYDNNVPPIHFPQTGRADPVSTFTVTLAAWMTGGFHFKLVSAGNSFEPDSATKVWRPCDGNSVWFKSGQVSLRNSPLVLTVAPVTLLYGTRLGAAPTLKICDPVEKLPFTFNATAVAPAANPLFQIATYAPTIYPLAVYQLSAVTGESDAPIVRPFPFDPLTPTTNSCVVLGIDGCTAAFPPIGASVSVSIEPKQVASTFTGGVGVDVGVGSAATHQTAPATLQADGTWLAQLTVVQTVENQITLTPSSGVVEPTPYSGNFSTWIDIRRFFTPGVAPVTYYTTEGVYGLANGGKTTFADPPDRAGLMQAAFGAAAGNFGAAEMPHGATIMGGDVYFVVHAPHAIRASLVLVNDSLAPATRALFPMTLTNNTLYWWCKQPVASAGPGTRYRFVLNDNEEVNDPAARAVQDRGKFETNFGDDPNNVNTSWSIVVDVVGLQTTAHTAPWKTMGWEALLMYEIHPARFADIPNGIASPLDFLVDQLQPTDSQNQPGYLSQLPITALQIMPVHEFKSGATWGYNPAFFFAIDGTYGGCEALARLVNAAHVAKRGVLLDLVYNHMNDSPLTQVAYDVYRNGDAWGDKINNAHPMVIEFFRQATVYLWQTFGLDGFRFDSTTTIIQNNGWSFLDQIHKGVRDAAGSEGQPFPYLVGENDPKSWDMTNPAWAVMDGQWDDDEVSDLGQIAYDPWTPGLDHSGSLENDMNTPQTWMRPFFEATRYGESHDTVGHPEWSDFRIAARPPYRMGLQMAKAVGTIALLSNGVPMIFMGQEMGSIQTFSQDNAGVAVNPQTAVNPPGGANDNTRVLHWFQNLMGLRNDPSKGLRGDNNLQYVKTGQRTVAFTCGGNESHFVVVTFGTDNKQQDSSWLGLPGGRAFKEIFNSSWPDYQVEFEQQQSNGGTTATIYSGQILNLPYIGAVVLEGY